MKITHFFTYAEETHEEESITIQISSTLVQFGPNNILIDTGFVGHKEVVYILNKMGLSALDITHVLNTHIHLDHVGGNRYFRRAQIYLSEEEYFFQRDYLRAVAEADISEVDGIVRQFYPEFNEKQVQLFGSLSVRMAALWEDDVVGNTEQIHFIEREWPFQVIEPVETRGHTRQHYAFKIHSPGKNFLAAGDALATRASFKLNKLDFPYCYDARAYLESKKRISAFAGIVIPGHDRPFDTATGEYVDDYESGSGEGGNGFDEEIGSTI